MQLRKQIEKGLIAQSLAVNQRAVQIEDDTNIVHSEKLVTRLKRTKTDDIADVGGGLETGNGIGPLTPFLEYPSQRFLEWDIGIEPVPAIEPLTIGFKWFVQCYTRIVTQGVGHAFDQPMLAC